MKIIPATVGIVVLIILTGLVAGMVSDYTSEEDDDLYVFVLTGQSNAAYYNYNVNAANEEINPISDGMAFYYGTASAPIYYGSLINPTYDATFESYGFHDMISNDRYVIGNIEVPFASEFVEKTGKRVYVINTGIPGQPISNMISGAAGDLYAKDVISHAMSVIPDGYDVKYGSVLFIQGESDSDTSVSDYISDFKSMMNSYADLSFKTVILSETRPSDGVNSSAAQLELCDDLPNVYLGSTAAVDFQNGTRYMAGDGLHYSQYGDNIIGADLANCYVANLYHSIGNTLNLLKIIPPVLVISIVMFAVSVVWVSRQY